MTINENEIFGLLKPHVDVHTLGISTIHGLLTDCGYKVHIAPQNVMEAATDVKKLNNISRILKWIKECNISILSYSYRLEPKDGDKYFGSLFHLLDENKFFAKDGGPIKIIAFAGLPDTCEMVKREFGDKVIYFPGNETPAESLKKYFIPDNKLPKYITSKHPYDKSLDEFASKYIESEEYRYVATQDHYGYPECGTSRDTIKRRLKYCESHQSLPVIRVHAGPYLSDRLEAIKLFKSWVKELSDSRLLDVLSIGSSQLTQSNFGENWDGLANGGGVPVNSEIEYREIAEVAKPMLVRTYAGTKNVPQLARIHQRSLNIAWHALSFWWFCELDGRGPNSLLDNLNEHIETIKYIASTGKPLEPNVPHHFSFRGGDDVTYIVSAYLAAKTAKKYGINHLILQNMLNTPKYTWGIEDIAKGRAMLHLVRELEDSNFKVSLQTRAGLDYFAPDLDKAKVQLAAITAMMDDIEPDNPNSPEIIHVVSYSEAIRLATPEIINESIKITLGAIKAYRRDKALRKTYDTLNDREINDRYMSLYQQSKEAISHLEQRFSDLYTPNGLYTVFKEGFLPVPFILDEKGKYPEAKKWTTAVKNGGVHVIDDKGAIIDTLSRYKKI